MDIRKITEALGKGGPARDIMLGNATGGSWADELCDLLVINLNAGNLAIREVNAANKRVSELEALIAESPSEKLDFEPDICELSEALDMQIDDWDMQALTMFKTEDGAWQGNVSRVDRNSWTCHTSGDAVTAILGALLSRSTVSPYRDTKDVLAGSKRRSSKDA